MIHVLVSHDYFKVQEECGWEMGTLEFSAVWRQFWFFTFKTSEVNVKIYLKSVS